MGIGVNVDTHSTDWLLHLQRVEGLWTTVQDKIRQHIRQTVHTSSHNNQYIFMPVLYTGSDKWMALTIWIDHIYWWQSCQVDRQHASVAIPSCQTHGGVMEEGENLFVLAALMWNE